MYTRISKTITFSILISLLVIAQSSLLFAETLDSSNYELKDITTDNGGGTGDSTNYSLLASIGNPAADARLTSGSYELKLGFPNGIQANVPKVKCFETTTTSGSTTCSYFPNANGAQGECGTPGCYNRAKLEVDNQNNPIDTLYLVQILDVTNSVTYYLKTDHTLSTTFTFAGNFMDRCDLEGRDPNNTACDDALDVRWNASLQKYNVLGLSTNTQYRASISAMSGDFTQTRFSPTVDATTSQTSISFDIDITTTGSPTADNGAPYNIDLGSINSLGVTTATNLIFLDVDTNNDNGMQIFVKDTNSQLASVHTGDSIPSESEDASLDPNHNGSYGLKTYNYAPSQSSLGPLIRDALYDTSTTDSVGKIFTSNTLIFSTNTTGTNSGPITAGRAAMYVKARAALLTRSGGTYNDAIRFNIVGNF